MAILPPTQHERDVLSMLARHEDHHPSSKDQGLLSWAASKLQEMQQSKTYGTITFSLEAGTITRAETKISEKPQVKP